MKIYCLLTFNVVLSPKELEHGGRGTRICMMDNSLISNATETHNELEKTTKESTKPTSKQDDQNNQNHSLTSFQSNVVSSPSSSEQNSPMCTSSSPTSVDKPAVVPQSVVEAIVKQGFPALAKTTKPIPASVFSYRFASPNNNQTPYYISSDIVLSGGIAQQTRRRIVHNEVERRRKDKINGWITKLAETIPGCSQGKRSKNIVLERAVEYFSEVNRKVSQLEECQQHRSSLDLDNQALKQRLEVLQKQNSELRELLHKNNIAIPENLACTTSTTMQTTVNVTVTNEHAPRYSGQLVASDNTNVTWMTPGKTPMATSSTSTITATEMNPSFSQSVKELLTSLSLSSASNVSTTSSIQQPAQTNYSSYTVSSIMNDVPQGVVSLVNGSNTQENTTPAVSLALAVNNTAVVNNTSNVVAANIPVAVNNKLGTQTLGSLCVPEGGAILGSQNGIVQDVGAQASNGAGTVYLAGSGGIVTQHKGPSAPQGVTQVILCQAPKISGVQESPSVNAPRGTFVTPVVTQSSSVINLSQQVAPVVSNNSIIIQTLGTPTVSNAPSAVRSMSNKPLFSSSINGISCTGASQKSSLQPQGVLALNSYVSAVPSVVATTNNPTNQGVLPLAISQGLSMATDNVCVLPSNVIQPGLVTLNTNTAPRVNTVPLTPQVLSEATPKPSHLVTRNLTSGLVTLNVPPKPVGVVTGTPNTILQQPQNLVAVNIPQTALQLSCTTSATSTSSLVSLPTSCANLTPSSRTAFVIVRSTQPQATLHYTIPSQAVSQINYNVGEVRNVTTNCVTLMSTRTTPSTVVQPALFQTNTGVLQLQTPISFSGIPSMSSAISETTSTHRNPLSSSTKSTTSTPSSQPSAKIPKSANARKRPSSRSHINSKTKNAKQSKSGHQAVSTSTSNLTTTSSTSQIVMSSGNETNNPHRNPSSLDICQHEDMLSIQNFSISSLIPSIDSQTSASENAKSSSSLNNRENGNGTRTPSGSTAPVKTSQPASNQRLSYSIDSLTGRDNVIGNAQNGIQHHQHIQQQQTQPNLLSFSAESLLGSGDDLVPNIQPITSSNATTNNFNTQNTLSISAFQESAADGTMNQTFSNFSAEALISESDLIGIPNEPQSSRSNCTQAAQSGKQTHNRTQMFSDFSAESLINSSDLGSGLSYAIDNLISRSDNNDNSIAMVSVNPNLLHTATSSMILPDSANQPMYSTSMPVTPMLKTSVYPHSTAMPVTPILKNHSLTSTVDYTNTTSTDQTSYGAMNLTPYSKYGFSSPQKQQKDIFSYKPNGAVNLTYPTNSVTTSPTFLKHSVDSITASQHNSTSSTGSFAFNSPACPTFNSLYFDQINTQQFTVGANSYSNNVNKNYQGPTMGSFA